MNKFKKYEIISLLFFVNACIFPFLEDFFNFVFAYLGLRYLFNVDIIITISGLFFSLYWLC